MSLLTNEKCTACRRDSPQVTEAEIQELKPQVPEWSVLKREGIQQLEPVIPTQVPTPTASSFWC